MNWKMMLVSLGLFCMIIGCQPAGSESVAEPTEIAIIEEVIATQVPTIELATPAEVIDPTAEPTVVEATAEPTTTAESEPTEIVVLYTNDEHGWIEGMEEGSGAAEMMGLWREQEGYEPNRHFVVLSGGDMWTGPAISTWFSGASTAEVMNAMGYMGAVIGNHEFDFGLGTLYERAGESTFPFLSANMRYKSNGRVPTDLGVEPYVMIEVAGVKIAIIGLTTTSTPQTTNPVNVAGFDFIDYETALREVMPQVMADGAELVFVPTHICGDELADLVDAVFDLNIDMFGAGHCNNVFANERDGSVLLSAGTGFSHYGKARFVLDDLVNIFDLTEYDVVRNVGGTADPEIEAIVAEWRALADVELGRVIGETYGMARRSPEMQQLITEAWLWAYPTADVAITNLGGMRADLPAGDVTIADVIAVMPFDNVLIEVELTGAQLVEVLELAPAAVGGASQYRSRWRLDDSGEWLDPEATYSVLVNDFMYAGGDDYGLLAEFDPEGYDTSINWRQPVIDWLEFEAQQTGEEIVDIASLSVAIDGDCAGLERPLAHQGDGNEYEFLSLATFDRCVLNFSEDAGFAFNQWVPNKGIYGTFSVGERPYAARINFDGSITDLGITASPYFASYMFLFADSTQILWSDGDFDPDSNDRFIAQLWVSDSNGGNQRMIYERVIDFTDLLARAKEGGMVFVPIGISTDGDALFSFEPGGRGGLHPGDFSNVYRIPIDQTGAEAELLYTCEPNELYCIGDFSPDLSVLAAVDRLENELFVVDIETGEFLYLTGVPEGRFYGRAKFNADLDIAFMIATFVFDGNQTNSKLGLIGWVEFPYDGFERAVDVDGIYDLLGWVDDDTILYYQRLAESDQPRYVLIKLLEGEIGELPEGEWNFNLIK